MSINWSYEEMYKWYTKQGNIRDDLHEIVYAIVYDAQKPSNKYVNKVEPFVKRNITYVGESPIQNPKVYPNGLYLVYDDNSSNKKWLFFVSPKRSHAAILADHMTFCYDKSDKKKACHFHSTFYEYNSQKDVYTSQHVKDFFPDKVHLPHEERDIIKSAFHKNEKQTILEIHSTLYEYNIDERDYTSRHIKDYFPDKVSFPGGEEEVVTHYIHSSKKHTILDIMKLPWVEQQSGSGQRTKAKRRSKPVHRPIMNQAFCNFWKENKAKSMTAIGFKIGDKITFTIHVINGRTYNNRKYDAFVFTCDANTSGNYEAGIQEFMSRQVLG